MSRQLGRDASDAVCEGLFAWLGDVFRWAGEDERGTMELSHQVLTTCIRSLEAEMRSRGVRVSSYTEHRVSASKADMSPDYVLCRRCEYSEKVDGAWGCSVFSMVVDGENYRYETSRDDGCSRGRKRKTCR